jgi:hypothetical protein
MIKALNRLVVEGMYLIMKTIYNKTRANILNGRKLIAFCLRFGTRQVCPFSALFVHLGVGSLN